MTDRFDLTCEALGCLGPLQWIRLSGGRHPQYGYQQVPFLGWRFAEPDEDKLHAVEGAVTATHTCLEWLVNASRRNWLLAPSRLLDGTDESAASPQFDDRVNQLMRDQGFCAVALADLDAILRTLRELGS
ncbi:hypothetical protein ABZ615_27660 [Streptomyces sp. NPDC007325]|uniref:hypothetical protein n=1 Tax=Streptomyces sp. NPDC007325 TaxID=3154588 RepID=UPI0033E73878